MKRELLHCVGVAALCLALLLSAACDEGGGSNPASSAGGAPRTMYIESGFRSIAVDLETGDARVVVTAPAALHPADRYRPSRYAFAPDGSRIAYVCKDDGSIAEFGALAPWSFCISDGDPAADAPAVLALDMPRPGWINGGWLLTPIASWSPDGRKVAFHVRPIDTEDAYTDVYVLDVESGDWMRVIENAGHEPWGPVIWSPDSSRFAIQRWFEGSSADDLFVVDAETGDRVDLAAASPEIDVFREPAWSPDGSAIAFNGTIEGDEDGSKSGVFVVSADGGEAKRASAGMSWFDRHDPWSPDSEWLAVLEGEPHPSDPLLRVPNVILVRADGSGRREVDALEYSLFPHWSPDGTHIVVSNEYAGFAGLYMGEVDGAPAVRITDGVALSYPWVLAWSPDGDRIFFTSGGSCGKGGCTGGKLYAVDADGGSAPELVWDGAVDRKLGAR